MDRKIVAFLKKEHVSSLTTLLADGTPHTSAMHFAMQEKPFELVFFTKNLSRKCKHFKVGKGYPSAIAIGFDEKKMVEFQAEGIIEKVNKKESGLGVKAFASKFKGAELDSEHIVLKFIPKWWRYTEYKPKFKIIESA